MSTSSTRFSANPVSRSFFQGRAKSQTTDRETFISQIEPKPSRGLMSRLGAGKIAGLWLSMRAFIPCRLFRGCFNRSSASNATREALSSSLDKSDSIQDFSLDKSDSSQDTSDGSLQNYGYSDSDSDSYQSSGALSVYTSKSEAFSQGEVQGSINDDLSQSASIADKFRSYKLELKNKLIQDLREAYFKGDMGRLLPITNILIFIDSSAENKIKTLASLLNHAEEKNAFLNGMKSMSKEFMKEMNTAYFSSHDALQEKIKLMEDCMKEMEAAYFSSHDAMQKKIKLMHEEMVVITDPECEYLVVKPEILKQQYDVHREQFDRVKKVDERLFNTTKKLHDEKQLLEAVQHWRNNADHNNQIDLIYLALIKNLGLKNDANDDTNSTSVASDSMSDYSYSTSVASGPTSVASGPTSVASDPTDYYRH